ncbi:MAG: hypothetical protein ABJB74_19190 [Gemmatimonas sp.]
MLTRSASILLLSASLLFGTTVASQIPRALTLGKPAAELTGTFTVISALRELTDGRVIVTDSRDQLVQLADFKTQTLTKIGRDGSGPGEFKSAGRLRALINDTTLMEDFANARFLVINPDGKAGATRIQNQGPFPNGASIGLDEGGVNYLTARSSAAKDPDDPRRLIRFDPRTKHADTITIMLRPSGVVSGASSLGGGLLKYSTNLPYAPEDVAAVARDGRVAVARAENYHVEWFTRDGQKIVGPVVKYASIEITSAERRAFLENQVRPGSITVQSNSAAASARVIPPTTAADRALFSAEMYDDRGMTWPARKPPFVANAVSIDGGGRAWVLRTTAFTVPTLTYDVFDAAAKVVLSVTLPPKTKVVGFGSKTLYLAFTDEDDLMHLHRYATPQ